MLKEIGFQHIKSKLAELISDSSIFNLGSEQLKSECVQFLGVDSVLLNIEFFQMEVKRFSRSLKLGHGQSSQEMSRSGAWPIKWGSLCGAYLIYTARYCNMTWQIPI